MAACHTLSWGQQKEYGKILCKVVYFQCKSQCADERQWAWDLL
ncbi:MAG: hypothetical protein ACI8R9_002878 [Paraglaciecola sp.]